MVENRLGTQVESQAGHYTEEQQAYRATRGCVVSFLNHE